MPRIQNGFSRAFFKQDFFFTLLLLPPTAITQKEKCTIFLTFTNDTCSRSEGPREPNVLIFQARAQAVRASTSLYFLVVLLLSQFFKFSWFYAFQNSRTFPIFLRFSNFFLFMIKLVLRSVSMKYLKMAYCALQPALLFYEISIRQLRKYIPTTSK